MDGDYLKLDGKWTSDEETSGTDDVASLLSQITVKVSYWSIKHERAAITPPEDFSNRKYRLSKELSHSTWFLFDSFKVYITSRGKRRFHPKRKLTRDSILKNTDTLLKRKCFENSFVELCKLNRILRFSFKVALLKISLREGGALNERLRIRPFARLWRWNSSRALNINHFGVNGSDFASARYSRNWEVKE